MNKTMEYMAYGLPSVAYDLAETRVSGADSVMYVPSGDIAAFADEIERLIERPQQQVQLGRRAREQVSAILDWRPQAEAYVSVFDRLSGFHQVGPAVPASGAVLVADAQGRRYVPLDDDAGFSRYLVE